MVATRCPQLRRATATCIAIVDLPAPSLWLPTTMTCADAGCGGLDSTDTAISLPGRFLGTAPPQSRHVGVYAGLIMNRKRVIGRVPGPSRPLLTKHSRSLQQKSIPWPADRALCTPFRPC